MVRMRLQWSLLREFLGSSGVTRAVAITQFQCYASDGIKCIGSCKKDSE